MDVRLVALLFLAGALAGCTGQAATPPGPVGRIDGAVVDHLLQPWGQTAVHLVELDRWTETTPLGGFSFIDVPTGFYTLEVVIEGVGKDRELVAVEEDDTTRIILQVFNLPPPGPYISELAHRATVQVAEPGARCDECTWSARLHERHPESVTVMAVWDPVLAPGLETHLIVEAFDEHGNRLLSPLDRRDETHDDAGRSVLCAVIPASAILPESGRVIMQVAFDRANPLPHIDFDVETFLWIRYGDMDDPAIC